MKLCFILATSIIGSYLVIRGFSFLLGGFPSESMIIDLIKNKESKSFDEILTPVVYAYLSVWLVLAVGAIIVQLKLNKEVSDEDLHYKEHKDNN